MADVSCRCLLVKGLPADAKEQDLAKCLENRRLDVLKVHSHTESQTDKRWIILLPDSKAVRECIKQGSWKVRLQSGEITVTPDYCSECIVPDDWIQKEEKFESCDLIGEPQGQQNVTSYWCPSDLHLALWRYDFNQIVDSVFDVKNDFDFHLQNPDPESSEWSSTLHSFLMQDSNQESLDESWIKVESLALKELHDLSGSFDSYSSEVPKVTSVHGADGQTPNFDTQKKLLQLAPEDDTVENFPEKIYQRAKFLQDRPQSEKIRPKEADGGKGNHTNSDPDETFHGDYFQDLGLQSELLIPKSPNMIDHSTDYTPLHSESIIIGIKYTNDLSCTDSQEDVTEDTDHDSTQTKKTRAKQGPINLTSTRSPWSSLVTPCVKQEVKQDRDRQRTIVKDKTTEIEVPQPSTGIFPQRKTISEPQQIIEGYPPYLTMFHSSHDVPSQNITMANMEMPQQHAKVSSERLTMPHPNTDTQLPNMGMPQPITGVPIQSMHVRPVMSWPVNSPFIAGELHSAVATGQVKVTGGTDSHRVLPTHAGHYHYNPWQTMPGYQINSSSYPLDPYGTIHPLHPTTVQHVPTASSQPICPPPQASFMHIMTSLRPPFGSQPHQGGFSGLEGPRHIAGQRSAASRTGPVEEDGGSLDIKRRPQSISNAESIEQIKTTDMNERERVEQGTKMRKRNDSDIKEDRPQSQINPILNDDQFQYNKDSAKNKNHPDRVNLRDSQRISHDDRLHVVGGFESHKKTSSYAQVDHTERGMNINKTVERLPSEDEAERFHFVDSENYARMKETFEKSVPGVQKRPHSEVGVDIQTKTERSHGKSASEKIESKPQKDQKDDEILRMIRVQGLTESVSHDALELFFENKKRCGGGQIESVEWGRNKREAFITFRDPSVVQSVLEKQKTESFYLEKLKLTVEEYVPPPSDPLRLFLTHLSPRVTHECLSLYLELPCNTTPTEILFGRLPGTALVTFSEPPDVEQLMERVKEKSLEGQYIQVIRVPITCCVRLLGLSPSTTRDAIELYFENTKCSGGGPVADVKFGREKQSCIISFKNAVDAKIVCMKQHAIDKKDIQVCLYYECLDDNLDADEFSDLTHGLEDTVGQLKLPDPVELKDLKPLILRFLMKNEKHKQVFEKNLSDINGVAKWPSSLEDIVIIECTVKVEDKNASSLLKDWSIRIVDKVKSFTTGIEVAEFNLIQMAWLRVLEELQTITIDNPEDVGVFVEQDKYKITVAGPRAAVEKLKQTIMDIIAKVDTQIAREKQRVTEAKQIKAYEMTMLRASRFKQDIEQMFPDLQFDLNQKDRRAIFVGQADIVQKAVVKMHEKLQSFVSISMPMSKAAMDLLFVKEISDYIKQKIISQRMIGVWYVVHKEEARMFGCDEREVQKAIQLVKSCLVEKEISLDDVMAQNVKGQQWLQLVERIQEKYSPKVAIKTSMTSILVVAVDDIFQDVFNEIKGYLEKHSVQDIILALEPVRVKFIKTYIMEDIKALEKKFESSHIKLFIIDHGDQRGIKINGTKDGCKEVKTALAEMAKNVTIKEHVMVNKVGLKELLQSSRGRDQLSSVEFRCKCFIEMKYSSTSGSQQQEGIKL